MTVSEHSIEHCLIGTLLNNSFLAKSIIPRVEASAFQDPTCEEVFRIASRLYREGGDIDQNTVAYAAEFPLDEQELSQLITYNEPDKASTYVQAIMQRRAHGLLENIFGEIGSATPSEFIENKIKQLQNIKSSFYIDESTTYDAKGLANIFLQRLKERAESPDSISLKTGLHELDKVIGGLEPTWLVVVGARPSMGKTTLALNILLNIAITGHRAMFFSLEMPAEEISNKLVSAIGNINHQNIRQGTLSRIEADRVPTATKELEALDIIVDDKGGQTWEGIEHSIRTEHHKKKLSIVGIDYVSIVGHRDKSISEGDLISEVTKAAKALAKELKIVILLLSQLNRKIEERADKRPVMSDLRASGQIEQDADLVIFPYREFIYTQDPSMSNVADLICGKFRHGTPKDVSVQFVGKYSKFISNAKECYNSYEGIPPVQLSDTGL